MRFFAQIVTLSCDFMTGDFFVLRYKSTAVNGAVYEHASAGSFAKPAGLTCGLGSEFVPVSGAHSQQPVAQVQVKPLLSSHSTHHLHKKHHVS